MIYIQSLRDLIDAYHQARGSGKQQSDALVIADQIVAHARPLIAPCNVVSASVSASRSLWRHAKAGTLEKHLADHLAHDIGAAVVRRTDIYPNIVFENVDDRQLPTNSPKKMFRHDARLSVLILPVKE